MRPDFLDRFARLDSPIHRVPAGVKLAVAVAFVVAVVALPHGSWWAYGAAGAALALIALLSRIPKRFLLRRILLLEPFVVGVAVLALLRPSGVWLFASLVIKSTLCLFAMVLLANTTPFSRMLAVLRRIRVPGLLITTLALMYRYIFVLVDEAQRMKRARASRTFVAGRRRTWTALGGIIARLFVRASERAERVYAAMCARGWR